MLSNNITRPEVDDWFDEIDVETAPVPAASFDAGDLTADDDLRKVQASATNAVRHDAEQQQPTKPIEVASVPEREGPAVGVEGGASAPRTARQSSGFSQLQESVAWRSRAGVRWASEHRGGVAVAVAVAVIGSVLVAAIAIVLSAASSVTDQEPADIAAIASTTALAQPNWCAPGTRGPTITSDGAGSSDSGPDAVLAFESAYYRRDVASAREMIAPTSSAAPAESLQQAVAALPKNVSHCVAITPARDMRLSADPNTFHVAITERDPNGGRRTWEQLVTTTNLGTANKPAWRIAEFASVPTNQEVPR